MPLRNFWASIIADRGMPAATGPDDKDGGIAIDVQMRKRGVLENGVRVVGKRDGDHLTLDVIADGETVYHERHPR